MSEILNEETEGIKDGEDIAVKWLIDDVNNASANTF